MENGLIPKTFKNASGAEKIPPHSQGGQTGRDGLIAVSQADLTGLEMTVLGEGASFGLCKAAWMVSVRSVPNVQPQASQQQKETNAEEELEEGAGGEEGNVDSDVGAPIPCFSLLAALLFLHGGKLKCSGSYCRGCQSVAVLERQK